jgi:hypothetical protein
VDSSSPRPRILFLFVDGLGLTSDPRSPLQTTRLPMLRRLTHGFSADAHDADGHAYRALDATLDVEGLPQSATGQTALLTGRNAAQVLGRHQGPHPMSRLQTLLADESLQVWASRRRLGVCHANGYRADYLQRVSGSRRNMLSAFAYAARQAGLPMLDLADPRAHRPGYWDAPYEAGRALAEEASGRALTVLEYWALDYAGHRDVASVPVRLEELDAFIAGIVEAGTGVTLVFTSDHGNAEEPWHTRHTRNRVPFVAVGPHAPTAPRSMASLTDVAPWLRSLLEGSA